MASSTTQQTTVCCQPPTNHELSSLIPPLPKYCKRIFLLRHGETDWNVAGKIQGGGYDIELNANGKRQAEAASVLFSDLSLPIGVVASSHLKRAKETANIIYRNMVPNNSNSNGSNNDSPEAPGSAPSPSKSNNVRRIVSRDLGEMRFGEFEGLPLRALSVHDDTELKRYHVQRSKMLENINEKWPGKDGESFAEVSSRSQAAIRGLLEQNPTVDQFLVVAHGRTNKILLASLLYGDVTQNDNFAQGNACINVIDFNSIGNKWVAHTLNYVKHIE